MKQVWDYTFENVNHEALCVVSGIRGCITRAAIEPTKRKSKAWFTNKPYELHQIVKTAFKKDRDNPILAIAEPLAAAKKNFKHECRRAKNIHVENAEKASIRIVENGKSHFWNILPAKNSQIVTFQVTQAELQSHLKTIHLRQKTPSWSLNSIKVTDRDDELT